MGPNCVAQGTHSLCRCEFANGDMAMDDMSSPGIPLWRSRALADRPDLAVTASLERATLGRRRQLHDVLGHQDRTRTRIRLQHSPYQRFGVRVTWPAIDSRRWTDFTEPSLVENGNPVRQRANDRQVMRDKDIGGATIAPELVKQIKNGRLNRDIDAVSTFSRRFFAGSLVSISGSSKKRREN
eukprot:gene59478-79366_t